MPVTILDCIFVIFGKLSVAKALVGSIGVFCVSFVNVAKVLYRSRLKFGTVHGSDEVTINRGEQVNQGLFISRKLVNDSK